MGRGIYVGAELTPAGWARLVGADASRFADRVVPLRNILGDDAEKLERALARTEDVAKTLDLYFLARLEASNPVAADVEALLLRLADPATASVEALAGALGLPQRALLRLARRTAGFSTKLLMRRRRFLEAAVGTLTVERGSWSQHLGVHGYRDQSHFVKDCNHFLGSPFGSFRALHDPAKGSFVHWPAIAASTPQIMPPFEDQR
jgi:AraC-like DNA-binding protein